MDIREAKARLEKVAGGRYHYVFSHEYISNVDEKLRSSFSLSANINDVAREFSGESWEEAFEKLDKILGE